MSEDGAGLIDRLKKVLHIKKVEPAPPNQIIPKGQSIIKGPPRWWPDEPSTNTNEEPKPQAPKAPAPDQHDPRP